MLLTTRWGAAFLKPNPEYYLGNIVWVLPGNPVLPNAAILGGGRGEGRRAGRGSDTRDAAKSLCHNGAWSCYCAFCQLCCSLRAPALEQLAIASRRGRYKHGKELNKTF